MLINRDFICRIYCLLLLLVVLATMVFGSFYHVAMAEEKDSEGIRAAYENTNVWDNLQQSRIAGNDFNIDDYPHNERDKAQLISFVEFCYSSYSDKQSEFGLYIYVYNPQDLVFDTASERNKIQLSCGTMGYAKYRLEFLNYSNAAGYEGRFYKFKIVLSAYQSKDILRALDENSRVYNISGIELSVAGNVTEYLCAQTYTYSGYVKGYGSELAESDTLSCSVDGFDRYIDLDVKHTVYRAEGDYYNGEQSQLNSCYFRVPNKFFEDYGELSKIVCEWYEYFTKPILVTETTYIYNKLNALHGAATSTLSDDMYFLCNVFWENAYSSWFGKSGTSEWTSNYPYQVGDTYKWGFLWLNGTKVVHEGFENFAAVFYSGSKAVEDYDVDGAALRDKLLANSAYVGGELLNDRYSKYLFEDYVQNGYEYGYNRKEIKADDMLDVFWHITTKNLWQTIFGGYDVQTIYDSKKAIEKLSDSDLSGSDSEIAESLYVNINDVKSIKDEYAKAKSNGESLVLFRYSTTRYMCAPCTATYCRKADVDNGKTLVKTNCEAFGDNDFNSYVAQETVYLDFDIISLWFTADGVETEIPVVSSPSDVIHGLQPPLEEDYHNGKVKSTFLLILGLIVGCILLLVLSPVIVPILAFIVKALLLLITLPFKAIGAVFKRYR